MQRRSFFRWTAALAALVRAPRWARGQQLALAPAEAANLSALGVVVLPAALGREGCARVVRAFGDWCANYRAHADLGYGYGHPRTRWSGPDPSRGYAAQLRALGDDFPGLAAAEQRSRVEAALQRAGVDALPRRPDGRHVASDLLGYFFHGADGEDFLYQARIMRDACRGLEGSELQPPRRETQP